MDWSPPRKPALKPAAFVNPCIPTIADRPPAAPAWSYEIKHDGYRLMVWRDGECVRLFIRNGFDWTQRYPWIVHSARRLRVARFLIDGEVVACGHDGIADFERLRSQAHDASAFLYAFDLLAVDGADTRREQLDERRAQLRKLLAPPDGIKFSKGLDGDGEIMFRQAPRRGHHSRAQRQFAPGRVSHGRAGAQFRALAHRQGHGCLCRRVGRLECPTCLL
jgi:bifunctional non-homologous end joining protein LigD